MYNHSSQLKPVKATPSKSTSKPKRPATKQIFKFRIDDYVRLAYTGYTFQRDYQQKWTTELFKISERFLKQNLPLYSCGHAKYAGYRKLVPVGVA